MPHTNQVDRAREGILGLIGSEFGPRDRIVAREVAARLGLSVTPVREALRQLSEQGYVEYVAGGGAYVREMDLQEFMDTAEVRIALEEMLVRRFATRATESDIQTLDELGRQYADAVQRRDISAARGADVAFHRYILDRAENQLMRRSAALRRVIFDTLGTMLVRDEQEEWETVDADAHKGLLKAMRRKDPDMAAAAMREHIAASLRRAQRRWQHRGALLTTQTPARTQHEG